MNTESGRLFKRFTFSPKLAVGIIKHSIIILSAVFLTLIIPIDRVPLVGTMISNLAYSMYNTDSPMEDVVNAIGTIYYLGTVIYWGVLSTVYDIIESLIPSKKLKHNQ